MQKPNPGNPAHADAADAHLNLRPRLVPRGQRLRKLLSYYRPYRLWLAADLACAFVVSATTLLLPLCTNDITKKVLESGGADALSRIYGVGLLMLALVGLQVFCTMFVDYQGHLMGARMERD